MQTSNIHEYARLLIDLHGNKAEVEAARKERELADAGENDKLEMWKNIRGCIKELRGPHTS